MPNGPGPRTARLDPSGSYPAPVTVPAPPAERARRHSEREVIAYLAFLGILLAFGIDTALPAFDELRPAFGLTEGDNQITLIITLYLLGQAFGQLVYGPFADRFGRVPVLRFGIAVYALGAIGSAAASNLELLFASRLVWGFGAAAPAVLRGAIARDLYEGNEMARVVSIMMAFFMIGPVLAPLFGQGVLALGSWEWVFLSALLLAAAALAWSFRFGETLAPEHRRELDLASIGTGFRIVLTNRTTLGYTLAMTFGFGSFFIFLGSAQPIFDTIYDREGQFAVLFGLVSITMGVGFYVVNRFIERVGAHRVAVVAASVSVASTAVLTVVSLTSDGTPGFWTWLVFMALANTFVTLLTPTCSALALEPMGELAGTASAVMGFLTTAGGSLLAAVVDAQIDGTVTPMAVAYTGYGLVALVLLNWARPNPN